VSLSSEVDCPRLIDGIADVDEPVFKSTLAKSRSSGGRTMTRHEFARALSTNCIDKYHGSNGSNGTERMIFRRFSICEDGDAPMEFEDLPEECKLAVFSFLTIHERGVAAQVCTNWHMLMRTASLWTYIDLTSFQACYLTDRIHQCTYLCYAQYRHRLKKFLEYLIVIRPVIKTLKFALDIDDPADGYRGLLIELIRHAHCQELAVAELIWTETPAKRPFAWQSVSATWSTSHIRDLVFRRHHRQRHFVRFFDLFTATVKNVSVVSLPFDWSDNSLNLLRRLTELREVTLRKYFRYATVDREFFCAVFASLPRLRRLTIELWTESAGGFSYFRLQSRTLEHLDVTLCRGLFISEMSLPSLLTFKVSRSPFCQVLGASLRFGLADTPCIYEILSAGAPQLVQLNSHVLHADWRSSSYPELELELSNVCSCAVHKPVAPIAD